MPRQHSPAVGFDVGCGRYRLRALFASVVVKWAPTTMTNRSAATLALEVSIDARRHGLHAGRPWLSLVMSEIAMSY